MLLSNKLYDVLKQFVQLVLPAAATLYVGLANLWHWGHVSEVAGTIGLIATFLGVLLVFASKSYNKSDEKFDGTLQLKPTADETTTIHLTSLDEQAVLTKDELVFKVNR